MTELSVSRASHSPPVLVGLLTLLTGLVVPLTAAGTVPLARAYTLAGLLSAPAVFVGVPYATLVAVGTLPLLWVDEAGFTSRPERLGLSHSLTHLGLGLFYTLCSTVVGVLAFALTFTLPSGTTLPRPPTSGADAAVPVPAPLLVGGLLVGSVFVAAQYRAHRRWGDTDRRRTLVTVALALLVAIAPAVAFSLVLG